MSRQKDSYEKRRERIEGQLACLGNAVVLLYLINQRMQNVIENVGRKELIMPAMEDLQNAEVLITRAQRSIAAEFEMEH